MSNPTSVLPEDIFPDDIIIAFMGPTKSGKTTMIDLLTGREEKGAEDGLKSVTKDVESTLVLHPESGKRIVFVDTPSFDNAYLTELQVLQRVASWLQATYQQDIKLFGIVYLQSIADHLEKPSTIEYLQTFERLCGEFAMAKVVFTTTMWEKVRVNDGINKEVQLVSKLWKPMLAFGATMDRLQVANYDEVWRIVDDLIEGNGESSRETLLLQVELVDLKRSLGETTAGQGLAKLKISPDKTDRLRYLAAATTKDVLNLLIEEARRPDKKVNRDDAQVLVNFMDLILGNEDFAGQDQRNRILTALSRTAVYTRIYPQRHILQPIQYDKKPVAKGAFGAVHKAAGGTVCVKVMMEVDEDVLKSYFKEMILWSRLSHPNILPFFGIFIPRSGPGMCLVSPWMKNGDLYSYTASRSQEERMPLLLDVADALAYVHQLGVVHSDLKGQNVLVSDQGRALLTDFGVSHVATGTMKQQQGTTRSTIGNSANFAAPEVLKRMFEELSRIRPDSACDRWSFGSLCYEIMTRIKPFYKLGPARIYHLLCNERRLPERLIDQDEDEDEYQEEIEDGVWHLITACWEIDPQQRPDSQKIREMTARLTISDDRPEPKPIGKPGSIKTASEPNIDPNRVEKALREVRSTIRQRQLN